MNTHQRIKTPKLKPIEPKLSRGGRAANQLRAAALGYECPRLTMQLLVVGANSPPGMKRMLCGRKETCARFDEANRLS